MKSAVPLDAYVPRIVARWLEHEPELRHRVVHGTLASADISGFTKLAERLAGDGRVGGENLTFALNEVFTLLIDEADALGGDVLKFGGDALLILFDGDRHAHRAVVAAARMQAAIESDRARTAAAGIALRMSVGASTGPIDLFLVGGEHRELIVTGPGATSTARLEDAADAGSILVDADCAAAVAATIDGISQGVFADGSVVIHRATALRADVTSVPEAGRVAATGVALPPSLRNQIAAIEQIGGEHRRATVGFVRFEGVDQRIIDGDVAGVVDDLDALVTRTTELTDRYSSTLLYSDIYLDGGKLLLTAGSPTSSGHDEESMLRTALALLDAATGFDLRVGVNAGPIFSGFLGSPSRRTFTVMGDAVNLAARLMQHARPGVLLASDELVAAAGTAFTTVPVEPFVVKGKSQPVRAGEVAVGQYRTATDLARDDLPFVGRADLLDVLVRLRDDAFDGSGLAVVLSGGSGSGKSRLVREMLEQPVNDVADAPVGRSIRLHSHPYDQLEAYAAGHQLVRVVLDVDPSATPIQVGDALRDHVHDVVPDLLPWLPLLAVFAGAVVDPTDAVDAVDAAFRRDRLHRVVLDYLDAALPGPTVLIIEDSHHLDDEMTALITWMASLVLADRPWLFALTTRTPVTEVDLVGRVISVPPLSVSDSEALVASTAAALAETGGSALSPAVVAEVAARSGGNPLFLRELAVDAALGLDGGRTTLPESVEGLLTARIDQLPADLRLQLRRAAVIGMDFSDDLLRAVGIDVVVPWGPAADFVQIGRGGTMRFRQTLFRDVAYGGLPYRHRRGVHAALAAHLVATDPDDVAAISLHFHLAERRAESFTWSQRAAADAAAKYANGTAAELYQRALDAAEAHDSGVSADDVADAAGALAAVLELSGRIDEADAALARAQRLLEVEPIDVARLGDVLRRRSVLLHDLGDPDGAVAGLDTVLSMLDSRDLGADDVAAQRLRASTLLERARVRFFQTRYDEAIDFAERAVDAASATDAKDTFARATMTLHLAHVTTSSARAADYRDVALPIFEALGDLVGQGNTLNNLGIEAYYAGRWDDAADFYERSRAARERCGDVVGAATSANNLAEILSDQGHLRDAGELLHAALAAWTASGFAIGMSVATSNLGRVAGRAGRTAEATRLLADAESRFRALGADDMATDALLRRAEAAVLGRDAETAEILARSVLAFAPPSASAVVAHRVLGLAAALRGDDSSTGFLAASIELAVSEGLDFDRVVGERVVAELRGRPVAGEVDEVARRLGIVSSPEVALVASLRASTGLGGSEPSVERLGDDDARVRALGASDLLGDVDVTVIRELARRSALRTVPVGSALIRQGDAGDRAFLVLRGRLAVSSVGSGRPAVDHGIVEAGQWVGEIAILSDEMRRATVTAQTDSDVVEVTVIELLTVLGRHPHVLRSITSRLVVKLMSAGEIRSGT